jgi:hypothetical protein
MLNEDSATIPLLLTLLLQWAMLAVALYYRTSIAAAATSSIVTNTMVATCILTYCSTTLLLLLLTHRCESTVKTGVGQLSTVQNHVIYHGNSTLQPRPGPVPTAAASADPSVSKLTVTGRTARQFPPQQWRGFAHYTLPYIGSAKGRKGVRASGAPSIAVLHAEALMLYSMAPAQGDAAETAQYLSYPTPMSYAANRPEMWPKLAVHAPLNRYSAIIVATLSNYCMCLQAHC